MTSDSIELLRKLSARCAPTRFSPTALFVAHCGVLTIVFDGFGACILDIKDGVDRAFPSLEEEHEGSMWPKVTLAVLKDGTSLSAGEVERIRAVADTWDEVIRSHPDFVAKELLAVNYGCRSLEIRKREERLALSGGPYDTAPPPHHTRFVRSVLSQFSRDRLEEYTVAIDRDGHRESHYRDPADGWTLVVDVPPEALLFAEALMDDVEEAVPGKYVRMSQESWHITIRSLDRAPG